MTSKKEKTTAVGDADAAAAAAAAADVLASASSVIIDTVTASKIDKSKLIKKLQRKIKKNRMKQREILNNGSLVENKKTVTHNFNIVKTDDVQYFSYKKVDNTSTKIINLDYLKNFKILPNENKVAHVLHAMSDDIITIPPVNAAEENLQKIKLPYVCSIDYESEHEICHVKLSRVNF